MSDSTQPGAAVVIGRPVVRGVGTFLPPGTPGSPSAADGTPVSAVEQRAGLLLRHKGLSSDIRRLTEERDEIEKRLADLDARTGLMAKLAAMTPAERALLEKVLGEKLQQQIDAGASTVPEAEPAE